MILLLAGLILFLGMHSIRIAAEGTRGELIARLGPLAYKGVYSLVSLIGLVLIIKGYAAARETPVELWPAWSAGRHVAALFTLLAFVLWVAAYVPRNSIKTKLRHPMVLGVKVWALGHLVANNSLADALLFGGFLLWAVLSFRAARQRDRASGPVSVAARSKWADALTLGIAILAYWAVAFHLHASLIGVRPFG